MTDSVCGRTATRGIISNMHMVVLSASPRWSPLTRFLTGDCLTSGQKYPRSDEVSTRIPRTQTCGAGAADLQLPCQVEPTARSIFMQMRYGAYTVVLPALPSLLGPCRHYVYHANARFGCQCRSGHEPYYEGPVNSIAMNDGQDEHENASDLHRHPELQCDSEFCRLVQTLLFTEQACRRSRGTAHDYSY